MQLILFILPLIFIFVIYLGYPAGIIFYRLFNKISVKKDEEYFPSVTMIIPAFNEEKHIFDKLENSLELDYPNNKLRIVLAIDGADDDTYKISDPFRDKGVEIFYFKERRGKISVMNDVVSRTDGEIILFSDANTYYDKKVIKKLVRNLSIPEIGMVCGRLTLIKSEYSSVTKPELIYWDYEHILKLMETSSGSTVGVVGSIYAIKRELYRNYPENTILDDLEIAISVIKQGYRVVYEPHAIANEIMVSSTSKEFSRKIRLISGGFQCVSRNKDVFEKYPCFGIRLFFHKLSRWLVPVNLLLILIYSLLEYKRK